MASRLKISGTNIRPLSRLLDASEACCWAIGPDGTLVYLSAGVSLWLGIDANELLGRRCVAGAAIADHPLDFVAATLSPPPGFQSRGVARLQVQPPPIDGNKVPPIQVRFIRVGDEGSAITIAVAGNFVDDEQPEITSAVAIRQHLDAWRSQHAAMSTIATAGVSPAARRLRTRLHIAASTRAHVSFFGPPGCGAETIAARLHQRSAPGEPVVTIDGPLMDAELLDASMTALISHLSDSPTALASVLIRGLDEMPRDAGKRLAQLLATFAGRLRLLAICSSKPSVLAEPLDDDSNDLALDETVDGSGVHHQLIDYLSAFPISILPLSRRVEDIPVLAAALVDAFHAAGEGMAERLSRAAIDAMVLYPWPENFEELEHSMRHAMSVATQEAIGSEHLPLAVRSYYVGDLKNPEALPDIPLDDALAQFEINVIQRAVEEAGGNRAKAARRLGISRARVIRRLDKDNADESDE